MRYWLLVLVLLGTAAAKVNHASLEDIFKTRFTKSQNTRVGAQSFSELIPVQGIPGYIQVNTNSGTDDIFYWLFKCDTPGAPLLIWLQGGPGSTSFYALATENGPFTVSNTSQITLNPNSWHTKANVLYLDQPIGTGFSHAALRDMVQNAAEIQDIASQVLLGFFELHKEFKGVDLYVTGESYGGHYVPYYANQYFNMQQTNPDVQLKGVAIGNGWVDAPLMYKSYVPFLLKNKFIDQVQADIYNIKVRVCMTLMESPDNRLYSIANDYCNRLYSELITDPITKQARFSSYDIRLKVPYSYQSLSDWLDNPTILNYLRADKYNPLYSTDVGTALRRLDWRADSSPFLKPLLDAGLKVLAYNGDQDYICNYISGQYWTQNTIWSHTHDFLNAPTTTETFGDVTQFENFAYVVVPGAGHMVPMDQPQKALDMITWFLGPDFNPVPPPENK